ncbi:hypothetical protein MMU07_17245 [Aquiflexum sp. LQ15W]|uniref:hypothetical protein n=1 Tax=Cognataquiflexum nitidum TaxID=2922272 RepID=UPI001F13E127|nr:hypothetical protein [Cognataquiflexum nitidum]MCH6201332.1 hypothetical protein [Cognataquiflexum nitidum]
MNLEHFLEQSTEGFGVLACGVRDSLYFRSEQELGTWNFEQFLEQSTEGFRVLACGVRGSLYFRSEQELGTWNFEHFLEQSSSLRRSGYGESLRRGGTWNNEP